MIDEDFFTFNGICEFLKSLKEQHNILQFSTWKNEPGVFIRHDIDLDLNKALLFAKMEAKHSILANYFFLVSSNLYNICSMEGRKVLTAISDLGHEIGLHFDPSICDESELNSTFNFEIDILENILGKKVTSVSIHNPSVYGSMPSFDGFINAYDPPYFSSENYLSDSRRTFSKDIYKFSKSNAAIKQVLIHPLHYMNKHGDYLDVLLEFLDYQKELLHQQFVPNSGYSKLDRSLRDVESK